MPLPDHLKPVVEAVLRARAQFTRTVDSIGDAGCWWPDRCRIHSRTDFLLVLSSQGRSIYDCLTGQQHETETKHLSFRHGLADRPSICGLCGADSFTLLAFMVAVWHSLHTMVGPSTISCLIGRAHCDIVAGRSIMGVFATLGRPTVIYRLPADSTSRAFGFSPTLGRSIVLASSSRFTDD